MNPIPGSVAVKMAAVAMVWAVSEMGSKLASMPCRGLLDDLDGVVAPVDRAPPALQCVDEPYVALQRAAAQAVDLDPATAHRSRGEEVVGAEASGSMA